MENRRGRVSIGRLGIICILPFVLLLQACFIRVIPGVGGSATSLLPEQSRVGVCDPLCEFELDEGQGLNVVLSATPNPGFSFVRWTDNLGPGLSACPNVTVVDCNIQVAGLSPALVGLEVEIQPQFALFDAFTFNLVQFATPGLGGVFVQLDNTRWLERYSDGTEFDHLLSDRLSDRIVLSDPERNRTTIIRFDTGIVSIIQNEGPLTEFGGTAGQSARTTGHLVSGLTYNNPFGAFVGELVYLGNERWVDRHPNGKRPDRPYMEVERADFTLQLSPEAGGPDLLVNFVTGQILALEGTAETLAGFVRSSEMPVTGWNVRQIVYAEIDSEEPLGVLVSSGPALWEDRDPVNGALRSTLREVERKANTLLLADNNSTTEYLVTISTGSIALARLFDQAPRPLWDILETSGP